ncbi:MAG: hypothetical protein FVQ85_15575 [Planctomycetes bacterium]|nr:hypothetical protein [Planctomycetota bacterium]
MASDFMFCKNVADLTKDNPAPVSRCRGLLSGTRSGQVERNLNSLFTAHIFIRLVCAQAEWFIRAAYGEIFRHSRTNSLSFGFW